MYALRIISLDILYVCERIKGDTRQEDDERFDISLEESFPVGFLLLGRLAACRRGFLSIKRENMKALRGGHFGSETTVSTLSLIISLQIKSNQHLV